MADFITESSMDFIAEHSFRIEKSSLYLDLGAGIKSVEFLRITQGQLLFLEAKTSFPNPDNPDAANVERFHEGINDICEKFIHSLNLYSSTRVGIRKYAFDHDFTLPDKVSLAFVLVIRNHELEWCKPIKLALINHLPLYLKKIWRPEVFVINHNTAIKYGYAR